MHPMSAEKKALETAFHHFSSLKKPYSERYPAVELSHWNELESELNNKRQYRSILTWLRLSSMRGDLSFDRTKISFLDKKKTVKSQWWY